MVLLEVCPEEGLHDWIQGGPLLGTSGDIGAPMVK